MSGGERWGTPLGSNRKIGERDPTWSKKLIGKAAASFLAPDLNPFKDKLSGRDRFSLSLFSPAKKSEANFILHGGVCNCHFHLFLLLLIGCQKTAGGEGRMGGKLHFCTTFFTTTLCLVFLLYPPWNYAKRRWRRQLKASPLKLVEKYDVSKSCQSRKGNGRTVARCGNPLRSLSPTFC